MTIAFIGLGNMGLPMANNLLKAGFNVHAYNRSPEKMKGFVNTDSTFNDLSAAVNRVDVVITMLSDDNALQDVSAKILPVLKKGSIHLSMSTVAPSTAKSIATKSNEHGVAYLASPVLGRPPAAEARQLFILLSGHIEAKEKVQPVLQALGQKIFDYGDDVSTANMVKLLMNYMIFVTTEMLSEVMLAAEKSGVEKQTLLDMMTSTIFGAPVIKNYGSMIVQEKDNPNGFATRLASKDLRLMQETAASNNLRLPLAEVIQENFKGMLEKQWGDRDVTQLISHLRNLK